MNRLRKSQKGFTLMELMVVIVIVAILAAVAVPLYINYVNDARDTEAKGAIGAIVTAEQTFRQASPTNVFAGAITDLNVNLDDVTSRWTFAVSNASGTGFTVTATNVQNTGHTVAYTYPPPATGDPWTVTP